ncbi:MAG: hypothetical protein O3B41_11720 [Bacteroidetes bacterium]|nr:hypothetical protein [Bacteroidota bacterium]
MRIVFQSTVKEAKSIRERALKAELSVPAYIRMVLKEADEDRRVEVYTDSQAQAAPQVLDDQTDAFEHPTGKEVKIVWKEGRP